VSELGVIVGVSEVMLSLCMKSPVQSELLYDLDRHCSEKIRPSSSFLAAI
jgi:hypothetical protein